MKLSSLSFYSRAMLPATFLVALGLTSVMAQTPRVTGFAAPASIIIDHKVPMSHVSLNSISTPLRPTLRSPTATPRMAAN